MTTKDWTRAQLVECVLESVRQLLAVGADFNPQSDLVAAGLDSLAVTQLMLAIEERTGIWVDESRPRPTTSAAPRPSLRVSMSSWRTGDAPLSGADCFLRSFDDEARRFHGASHLSQLVLRLGPNFDVDRFRVLIRAVVAATPILRAPIRRRFAVGPPVYRLARAAAAPFPPVAVEHAPLAAYDDTAPPALFAARLNARVAMERGELVRFDVVRYGDGQRTDLAMTWAHLLFDGAGSELFIRRLDECFHGRRAIADLAADDPAPARPRGTLRERARRAQWWQAQMIGYGAAPPRSLGGPRRRVRQALAYDVVTLSPAETALVTERAAAVAGYLTPVLFYLAAAIRAHDAVFTTRGEDPGHYLVPLPVNRRAKGGDCVVFRTNVSLLWFHVARAHVGDLAGLVAELMRQRRDGIRDGAIEAATAAMEFVRLAPARLHSWVARNNLGGELASFYFAFTNEFLPGMATFLDAEIANGFHVPSVMPSPGTSLIMSIRDGRLNVTLIWQRGVISDDERLRLREQLLDDLVGRASGAEPLRSSG